MFRGQGPAALLLLALSCTIFLTCDARLAPGAASEEKVNSGRALLQGTNCTRISKCNACYAAKDDDSTTTLYCRSCDVGYRPSSDQRSCECAPGHYPVGELCTRCPLGSFCLGGTSAMTTCGTGLTTLTEGARTVDQCVAQPGWGYIKTRTNVGGSTQVSVSAAPCPPNFFNPGRNTLPCRRCPGGLITDPAATSGATSTRQCLAGPGYLYDKLVAKACPRGTWKDTISSVTRCNKCPLGLTTNQTASTHQDNCTQAMPGHEVVTATQLARACPINFYNPGFESLTCIQCPMGLVTVNRGSRSISSCVAPPGVGFNVATGTGTPCPPNFFKAGFNRKPCESCGNGFLTLSDGSESRQRCYVPAGFGTVAEGGATRVVKCEKGLYGYGSNIFGVFRLPCRACQEGMTTLDMSPSAAALPPTQALFTSPNNCFTLPGWGYDRKAQAAKKCEEGNWNVGWNMEPCRPCGDGLTTAENGAETEAAASAALCVTAPGWYHDHGSNQPVPCEVGSYCPGLVANASDVACPNGTTTMTAGAKTVGDCSVCLGGYGSWVSPAGQAPSCSLCPANTFGPLGAIESCRACPDNTVSKNGSDSQGDCYNRWQVLKKDFDVLPVPAAALVAAPGTFATEGQCQQACDSAPACVFYIFDKGLPSRGIAATCKFFFASAASASVQTASVAADSAVQMGMKVDEGVYSVVPTDASAFAIGVAISSQAGDFTRMGITAASLSPPAAGITGAWLLTAADSSVAIAACTRRCDEVERCVAAIMQVVSPTTLACGLRSGEMSAFETTKYRIAGLNIDAWFTGASWGAGALPSPPPPSAASPPPPSTGQGGGVVLPAPAPITEPPSTDKLLGFQTLPLYLPLAEAQGVVEQVQGADQEACWATCLKKEDCALYSWATDACYVAIHAAAGSKALAGFKLAKNLYQTFPATASHALLGSPIAPTPELMEALQEWAAPTSIAVSTGDSEELKNQIVVEGLDAVSAQAGCQALCDGVEECLITFLGNIGDPNGKRFSCGLVAGLKATDGEFTRIKSTSNLPYTLAVPASDLNGVERGTAPRAECEGKCEERGDCAASIWAADDQCALVLIEKKDMRFKAHYKLASGTYQTYQASKEHQSLGPVAPLTVESVQKLLPMAFSLRADSAFRGDVEISGVDEAAATGTCKLLCDVNKECVMAFIYSEGANAFSCSLIQGLEPASSRGATKIKITSP